MIIVIHVSKMLVRSPLDWVLNEVKNIGSVPLIRSPISLSRFVRRYIVGAVAAFLASKDD